MARQAGFTVFTGPLDEVTPKAAYDVAVLSNVLEHALDPKAMLLSVRRLLKPEGQVWISCPNSQSWLRTVFGRAWINWHVPFHITHFSADSLRALLEECGFTLREIAADYSGAVGGFFDRGMDLCPRRQGDPATAQPVSNVWPGAVLPGAAVSAALLGQPARAGRLPGRGCR